MNYTYLPTTPYTPDRPTIVMTTNPASKKTTNLQSNPNVSLLVHDWVSHRPPTTQRRMSGTGAAVSPSRSSLATLLLDLNTAAMSSISATINGSARLVQPDTDEEKFYRKAHLENNTFEGDGGATSGFNPFGQIASTSGAAEDGGRECFVAGEEVRVIVVDIKDVRISDWKGNVKDWVIARPDAGLTNGPSS